MSEGAPPEPTPAEDLRTTEVDLGGLVNVLATHLYSTPLVALRELVQNAHDSHTRRLLEDPDGDHHPLIRVRGDAARRTVAIEDTGAGLTEPEIHAYLATVGTGYTRMLRDLTGNQELIGAFGLGFLSAFSVADEVVVTTTSHREPQLGHRYRSRGGEQYQVDPVPARPRPGTVVELTLKAEHAHLADEDALREVLGRYCVLLPIPVYVGDDEQPVNSVEVPWRGTGRPATAPTPDEHAVRMRFATAFGRRFEPLTAFPVDPVEGGTDAIGLLWVQDGGTYGSSDNRDLAVYLRGMLLAEDARDLLPSWAGFIGGVVESNRLTPTASREDLQRDDHYRALQRTLTDAIVDGLYETARLRPAAWRRILTRHGQDLLGAALCDERLFTLLADDVPVPTSQGDLTAGALRAMGGERCTSRSAAAAASRRCCTGRCGCRSPAATATRCCPSCAATPSCAAAGWSNWAASTATASCSATRSARCRPGRRPGWPAPSPTRASSSSRPGSTRPACPWCWCRTARPS